MNIDRLRGLHSGRSAVILGGGPSLPKHIKTILDDAVVFGVNFHASRIVDCDYIVFNDEHTIKQVENLKGRKISRWGRDVIQDAPRGLISGVLALRAAKMMGCAPIILMGFDCYENKGHFYNLAAELLGNSISVQKHVDRWKSEDKRDVYVAGGPLKEVFKMAKNVKTKPKFMKIKIFKALSVLLDNRRSVNFKCGVFPKMPRELAEAAITANCGKLIEKD